MTLSTENVAPNPVAHIPARRALSAIVAGGLTAGALDIAYAFTIWGLRGVSPIRIGQSISAGLLGPAAALSGGVPTGLLGLLLHFAMALLMAACYYILAARFPLLVKRAAVCGVLYGLGLYVVMNYVVVPLSAIGSGGGNTPLYIVVTGVLVHMFFVGLPIALFAGRALRRG